MISTQVVPVPGTFVVGAKAYTVDTVRGGRYTGVAIMDRDTYKYVYSDTRRAYEGTISEGEVVANRLALDVAIAEARKTGVCPRSPARVRAVCEVFMRIIDRPIIVIPTPDERDGMSKECALGKELAYRNNNTEIAMCLGAGGRVVSIDNGDACGRNAKVECEFHSPEQPPDDSGL